MFPDSDIARSFACGSDKTAYVSKFGIAPCISNSFVLIFDVSLNQTTKICMSAVRAKITSSPHMRNISSWDMEQSRIYYTISK